MLETSLTFFEFLPPPSCQNVEYITYYILLANFIFMGIMPCAVMIFFNMLVARAVAKANKRRARYIVL
jgi:hypothetical protein